MNSFTGIYYHTATYCLYWCQCLITVVILVRQNNFINGNLDLKWHPFFILCDFQVEIGLFLLYEKLVPGPNDI